MNTTPLIVGCALALFSLTAFADVEVRFIESAPKDRFVIANTGACELTDLIIDIDLLKTRGKLVFDTTAGGAGVEVFQPFEPNKGDVSLLSSDFVKDGDTSLSVKIVNLPVDQTVSFTIDVDDTLENGELGNIRVTGSEMQGGTVTLKNENIDNEKVVFDVNSLAVFESNLCS